MSELIINGVVAKDDKQPYLQISSTDKGPLAQLTMAQARSVAIDILQMCARTEADAMIWKFIHEEKLPEQLGTALMYKFRDFRAQLDDEEVATSRSDPETGERA